MPRPKTPRRLRFKPNTYFFKPQGIPLKTLEEVELAPDELEAIKLHDYDGYDQTDASKKMRISQPTFARILNGAYKKIAKALVESKAIKINKK